MGKSDKPSRRNFLKITGPAVLGGMAGCLSGNNTPTPTQASDGDGSDGDSEMTDTPSAEELSDDELMELADPPDEIVFVNAPVTPHTHWAIDQGLFEKRGLNVRLTEQPVFNFEQNLTLAATGKADVSVGTAPSGMISLAKEQDIFMKMIFPMVTVDFEAGYYGYTFTVVNPDSGYEELADLAGEEFAHFGSSVEDLASMKWLADQHGLDPAGVDFGSDDPNGLNLTARIPLNEIVPAVARNEVAGGNSIEPRILAGQAGGANVTRLTDTDGQPLNKNRYHEADGGGITATWGCRPEFAEDYPHTVKLLQRAMAETLSHIYDPETQDDYIAFGAQTLRVSEDVYRQQVENRFTSKPVESVEEVRPWESMQKFQDVMNQYVDYGSTVDVMRLILPWDQP